ncbi:phage head-tail adapter protein [Streptomyces sp. LP11]|uniref:Phage head-tail adapter protein n=1 Tax=Streptomyces pyxinicus TaxID=2970331 RepID=A0ABT2AXY3_9ACTN|nr:phage head-tail adapter protein [Streptomyces sp. LP11]MCS0601104.1 phage head-tail adapter protein [Streptomyces sp. LP11]
MSSLQRRRGVKAKVWKTKEHVDSRGNKVLVADPAGPVEVRCALIPQRSARAEVPGQMQINITRMIVSADLSDVTLWSRVEALGTQWDIVTPPAYHHGNRKTRHWAIDIRERPS